MKPFHILLATSASIALAGCSANFTASSLPIAQPGIRLSGSARGGQQPLTGTHVYLFAAGKTGYGSASTSLLHVNAAGVSTDGSGNGYVTSDSGGTFTITGDWSCANASDQLYMVARGGNPGLAPGTNNASISMVAALGSCSALNASTFVVINELSTVAAAYALQQFAVDTTDIGTSPANTSGLAQAFATVFNMVDAGASQSARATTPTGNGTVPQATLNSIANILSVCVNSNGSGCSTLFFDVMPSGTQPTDTFVAALDMAKNPVNPNTPFLFFTQSPTPPFQPTLASAPADLTIGISYTLGVPAAVPGALAIDGQGNVWLTSNASQFHPAQADSVIKLANNGQVLSGATGFQDGGYIFKPQGIAIDDLNTAWVTTNGVLDRLNPDGSRFSGTNFPVFGIPHATGVAIDTSDRAWISNFGTDASGDGSGSTVQVVDHLGNITSAGINLNNVYGPQGVAIDTTGDVWVSGQGTNSLARIGSDFALKSPAFGYGSGGLSGPAGAAIDATGRVWVADTSAGSGIELLSVFAGGFPASDPNGYNTNQSGLINFIAIDGANTAWTASCGAACVGGNAADTVIHMDGTGTLINTPNGFRNSTLATPQGVAIDASGNLWVGNSSFSGAGTVTELVGVAAPVKTPIQAALKANLLGQRP